MCFNVRRLDPALSMTLPAPVGVCGQEVLNLIDPLGADPRWPVRVCCRVCSGLYYVGRRRTPYNRCQTAQTCATFQDHKFEMWHQAITSSVHNGRDHLAL